MTVPLYEKIIVLAAIVLVLTTVGIAIYYAFGTSIHSDTIIEYDYNVSRAMLSDNWTCGYINPNTTLEDVRECFRD